MLGSGSRIHFLSMLHFNQCTARSKFPRNMLLHICISTPIASNLQACLRLWTKLLVQWSMASNLVASGPTR